MKQSEFIHQRRSHTLTLCLIQARGRECDSRCGYCNRKLQAADSCFDSTKPHSRESEMLMKLEDEV